MRKGDTIFALSSGGGLAGVAVFRLSGPKTRFALETIGGTLPSPRRASLRALRRPDDGGVIDHGLVLWLPGPESFSGEDMCEFHVHGGRAVRAALGEALAAVSGLRMAEAGEFTRRAFENGKLDLTEAEGLADLIAAETEAQRRQAVAAMEGMAGRLYEGWRSRLVQVLAHVEAGLDFSDEEDVGPDTLHSAQDAAGAVAEEIAAHLADGHRGERLRDGVKVVIAGPVNAGKSTLMNALARRDVAIVSQQAGTTRDVLEVHLDLGGYPVILSDTAGLRETSDEVEAEGLRRAQRALEQADIVLWLEPASGFGRAGDNGNGSAAKWLYIASKWDEISDSEPDRSPEGADLALSAARGWGMDGLIERLGGLAGALCGNGEDVAISRLRHRQALADCRAALQRLAENGEVAGELQAEELRLAADALGRITGRVDVEDLLDVIFADFCIGK
jgi:tRNA modification GTPase